MLRMPVAGFEQVLENREVRIYSVEQPKIRNIAGSKVREFQIALPARSSQKCALRTQYLHQAASDGCEIVTCREVEKRWNEARIQLEYASLSPLYPGNANAGESRLYGFSHDKAEILAGDLNGFFAQA